MTKTMIPAALCFLLSGLGAAHADVAIAAGLVVTPPVPVPAIVPPAPPLAPPVARVAHYVAPRVVVAGSGIAGGQWVYTVQYGWIYMPYGDQYFHTRTAGPYAYVYYPTFGWQWLAAPWIVGTGPYPYFGAHGPFAYGWYRGLHRAGHPWGSYYARRHGRPWVSPRAAVHARAGNGVRGPAARAPGRPAHTPDRSTNRRASPATDHRERTRKSPWGSHVTTATTASRPAMIVQRSVRSAVHGPAPGRGISGQGRAVGPR
jgi:hypothetical protein